MADLTQHEKKHGAMLVVSFSLLTGKAETDEHN